MPKLGEFLLFNSFLDLANFSYFDISDLDKFLLFDFLNLDNFGAFDFLDFLAYFTLLSQTPNLLTSLLLLFFLTVGLLLLFLPKAGLLQLFLPEADLLSNIVIINIKVSRAAILLKS